MNGNAQQVIGAFLSVPINMINGLADLLISKGVISRAEVIEMYQRLISAVEPSEDADAVRELLQGAIRALES